MVEPEEGEARKGQAGAGDQAVGGAALRASVVAQMRASLTAVGAGEVRGAVMAVEWVLRVQGDWQDT